MSGSKSKREPASDGRRFTVTFWPYTGYTVAEIDVGWRDGAGVHRSRLARWHLRIARSDLAGHTTDDVLRGLIDGLVRRVESGPDSADRQNAPVGPGVPLGTTGGTVPTDSPPVPEPTLGDGRC